MPEFLNLLNKYYDQNSVEKISKVYENLKDLYQKEGLYTIEFAEKIGTNIMAQKLDYESVIIGLIYPVYKANSLEIDPKIMSKDVKNIFERLEKIENLNLSTHQEQLENICQLRPSCN